MEEARFYALYHDKSLCVTSVSVQVLPVSRSCVLSCALKVTYDRLAVLL